MAAWREFRRGKRKKLDVVAFELNLEDNIFELHRKLADGNWRNDPYVAFKINDPKSRIIHKASVRDRVLFQAIYRKLYEIFDRNFIFDSYSSRIQKGTHAGIKRFEKFSRKVAANYQRRGFVLKCDIRKFFDSIDHDILTKLIERKINDEKLSILLRKVIDSFHHSPNKGLPLGNVTSQLFSNVYLNELDQFVKHDLKVKYYIRYCDDFVILYGSQVMFEAHIYRLRNFLRQKLSLELHPQKIEIRKLQQGIDFLGYVSLPNYRVLRTRTKKRMFRRLMNNTKKETICSYLGLLKHGNTWKLKEKIVADFSKKCDI